MLTNNNKRRECVVGKKELVLCWDGVGHGQEHFHTSPGSLVLVVLAFFSPDAAFASLVNPVNPVLGSAKVLVHHSFFILKKFFVLWQKALSACRKFLANYSPKIIQLIFLTLRNSFFVDLVPVVPHLPHNQPELPDEFGFPSFSLVLFSNVCEVCLLVISKE